MKPFVASKELFSPLPISGPLFYDEMPHKDLTNLARYFVKQFGGFLFSKRLLITEPEIFLDLSKKTIIEDHVASHSSQLFSVPERPQRAIALGIGKRRLSG